MGIVIFCIFWFVLAIFNGYLGKVMNDKYPGRRSMDSRGKVDAFGWSWLSLILGPLVTTYLAWCFLYPPSQSVSRR